MPDKDVGFLDALRVAGRHIHKQIDLIGEGAAGFSGQSHPESAATRPGLHPAHDVWAGTAGGDRHEDISSLDQ